MKKTTFVSITIVKANPRSPWQGGKRQGGDRLDNIYSVDDLMNANDECWYKKCRGGEKWEHTTNFFLDDPKNAEYNILFSFGGQVMASDGKWWQVVATGGKWVAEWPLAASHAGQVGHQGQHQLLNTSTITTTPLPLILPPLPLLLLLLLLLLILRILLLLLLLLGSTPLCKSWHGAKYFHCTLHSKVIQAALNSLTPLPLRCL